MANVQCNDTDKLCPDNCEAQVLPEVLFDDCAPELNRSEIEWIILGKANTAPFKDLEDLAEWNTRIKLVNSHVNSLRILRVVGDKPAAEDQTAVISGQRTVVSSANHTVNFDVDETNKVNYEFIRTTACNSSSKVWYVTVDGLMYGGICGLKAQIKMRLVQARGENEIEKYTGTLTWKDRFDPPRAKWPLAGMTNFKPGISTP